MEEGRRYQLEYLNVVKFYIKGNFIGSLLVTNKVSTLQYKELSTNMIFATLSVEGSNANYVCDKFEVYQDAFRDVVFEVTIDKEGEKDGNHLR